MPDGETPIQEDNIAALEKFLSNKAVYLEMMIENLEDMFWIFDAKEERLIYISEAFTEITGYDRSNAMNDIDFIREIVVREDAPIFEELYSNAVTGKASDLFYRVISADGKTKWLRSRSNPVLDQTGKHTHAVGICRDVTERKQVELALRDSKNHYQELAKSNRQLVMEVNHRVRNNLGGLLSLIKLTKRRSQTVDYFAASMMRRIKIMSVVHDSMAQADWGEVEFRDLLRDLLRTFETPPTVRVSVDGPSVKLRSRQVMPLIFSLMEMYNITGYTKPLKMLEGEMHLQWEINKVGNDKFLKLVGRQKLRIADSSVEKDQQQEPDGLAEELVKGFVEYELGGTFQMYMDGETMVHLIEFALDDENYDSTKDFGSGI